MSRPVGGTEHSWCRAVHGGTGIIVLALLFSKPPNPSHLQTCLHKLQNSHPILRSKLRYDPSSKAFSFVATTTSSALQIHTSDLSQSFYLTLEHEMNTNAWHDQVPETEVMFASLYSLPDHKWAVALRLHTVVCDRDAAAFLMRELLGLLAEEDGGVEREIVKEDDIAGLPIEDCVPCGKFNKTIWGRGVNMLGYSLNSLRFSNLEFKATQLPNSTQFVRMKIGLDETHRILSGCKSRGIKLCGVLAAAGLIAAHASKNIPNEKRKKYSLATLIDCRSLLDPVLSDHHFGFYHSAVITSHDVKGGEDLWDLAHRIYTSIANAKKNNKHFTDMADLNYLMTKAIDNPGLTPSSTLRTSLVSVFEETVIENSNQFNKDLGLLDCIGCASVHGVGPSLAISDTIRNGELDCACVYPFPTHSREQMQDLVNHMKKILLDFKNL